MSFLIVSEYVIFKTYNRHLLITNKPQKAELPGL